MALEHKFYVRVQSKYNMLQLFFEARLIEMSQVNKGLVLDQKYYALKCNRKVLCTEVQTLKYLKVRGLRVKHHQLCLLMAAIVDVSHLYLK